MSAHHARKSALQQLEAALRLVVAELRAAVQQLQRFPAEAQQVHSVPQSLLQYHVHGHPAKGFAAELPTSCSAASHDGEGDCSDVAASVGAQPPRQLQADCGPHSADTCETEG